MPRTIADLLQTGLVLRWWCFDCAEGREIPREKLADMWFLELAEVAIRCPKCRRLEEVITVPTAGIPEPPPEPVDDRPLTSTDVVSFIFFASRSAGKKRKRLR